MYRRKSTKSPQKFQYEIDNLKIQLKLLGDRNRELELQIAKLDFEIAIYTASTVCLN